MPRATATAPHRDGLLGRLLRPLEVVLPTACAACGLPGEVLCGWCRAGLEPLHAPWCARCGHPCATDVPECARCPPGIAWARQAVAYAGPAPALVAALKDRRLRGLARHLGEVVAGLVPAPPGGTVLVPVPLGRRRHAERGFNQSALLARALGGMWNLPVDEGLERRAEGPPQRGAAATDRVRQVAGAFQWMAPTPAPERACLVDDVHTTGATLAACGRALRRAGAREVRAVAVARAVGRWP